MEFNSISGAPESDPEAGEASAPRPLAELAPGSEAVVVRVDPEHPIGRRLLDLGFAPGTPIRVLRRAPLGDPVSYELRGMQLCLRRAEAEQVLVRPRT